MLRIRMLSCLILIGAVSMAGRTAGEPSTVKYTLDAAALEERGQLREVLYDSGRNWLTLKDMLLVEDDAPAIGKPQGATDRSWFEKLQRGVMARKDLVLDDPRAFAAYLVFNGFEMTGNEEPLHIGINGKEFLRLPTKYAFPLAKQYYTREWTGIYGGAQFDNWFRVEIPSGMLRKGNNEIILRAESEKPGWEIMVASEDEYKRGSDTRLHHPNRSAKSRDGGATWNFDRLGWKDEIDGEYCVRLSLDRFVPEGMYVSPVIDLAEEPGKAGIKKHLNLRESRVSWNLDLPEGAGAEVTARLGRTPVPSAEGWSAWEPAKNLSRAWKNPAGRYLQFKVTMKTANPLATPVLRGVTVETTAEEIPRKSNVFHRLVEFRNGRVIRSSVPFTHEDFLKLKDVREKFELDNVVAGASTEFEAQLRLMRWAYEIPTKGFDPYAWRYSDLAQFQKDEKGNIVYERDFQSKRRHRPKFCLTANLTLIEAFLAMGYPARWVNIATMSTYGHEVAEVWSNDLNKWVFMDANKDYYIYDPDTGVPMDLIEINGRLREILTRPVTWEYPLRAQVPNDSLALKVRVAYREGKNKFSVRELSEGPLFLLMKGHPSMVIRNDFASRPTPVPWRTTSHWGGPLFYGYYSDIFPRKREYALHTNRRQDFYPTLNQAELTVSETDRADVLRADVDSETPCFQAFTVQFDNGEWKETPSSSFEWPLHEGLNTLRVRVRNTAGVFGPESYVKVVMNE
ncbi:MAG: transglutaminase-like domain-containing protein [Candidatus Latescibacterota bacterium]